MPLSELLKRRPNKAEWEVHDERYVMIFLGRISGSQWPFRKRSLLIRVLGVSQKYCAIFYEACMTDIVQNQSIEL